jgi:putative transposase
MRKSRFAEEQILAMVAETRTTTVAEVARRHGVNKNTLARWRAKYAGMELDEARRLKRLEDENRRLKKLVADLSLDNAMLKDLVGRKW